MRILAVAIVALALNAWTAGYLVLIALGMLASLGVLVEVWATIWRAERTPFTSAEIKGK